MILKQIPVNFCFFRPFYLQQFEEQYAFNLHWRLPHWCHLWQKTAQTTEKTNQQNHCHIELKDFEFIFCHGRPNALLIIFEPYENFINYFVRDYKKIKNQKRERERERDKQHQKLFEIFPFSKV